MTGGSGQKAVGVRSERAGPEGQVLVLTLMLPAGKAPGVEAFAALEAALDRDPGARGVVLCGAGAAFAAALPEADPDAPDTRAAGLALARLCRRLETAPRPVVFALAGTVAGPAAELALAAHLRVAATGSRIVLPGVALGMPPVAGASQRLPRLVGAAEALRMLLGAVAVGAEEALAIGLVDQVTEGDPRAAAIAAAATLPGPRPTSDRSEGLADAAAYAAAVAAARAQAGTLPAPGRIVDCVEAALVLPFEAGLAMEAVAAEDLAGADETRGLIASARAARRAARLPVAAGPPVDLLGLAGTGPQIAHLAAAALAQGLRVVWFDPDPARLAAAEQALAARMEAAVRAGRLGALQRDADRARLATVSDLAGLGEVPVMIHAARGADYAVLSRRRPQAVHVVLNGAEGALGLSLAPSGRLSELALPEGAAPDPAARVAQVLRRIGLPPVLTGRVPGIGRRMAAAGQAARARIEALGVPPATVEAALADPPRATPDAVLPAGEIRRRWLAALANEGARLVEAGIARRPSDIDHVMVQGLGFPRWQGGPMHQADRRGMMVLRADLRRWQREDAFWTPAPLIDRLVSTGGHLADLDR